MKNKKSQNSNNDPNISHNNYLDKDRNVVQVGRDYSYSKSFLRVIPVLLSVIVSVSVATLELGKSIKNSTNPDVKLELLVQSETTNEPLSNVKVTFSSNGAPVTAYTDSNGYVAIAVSGKEELNLTLRKEGFQTTNLITNLASDSSKVRILRLESEVPSLQPSPSTTPSPKEQIR